MKNFKEKADLIWRVADLLRGDYKQSDYGKVILPMTVLRRLDCVLEPTKQKVLDYLPKVDSLKESAKDIALNKIAGFNFHNRSQFNFDAQIERMDGPQADILFRVIKSFQEIDLKDMDSMEMGYVFEDLIRRFAEQSNETAGEHFTPREVIRLMVNVLFIEDKDILTQDRKSTRLNSSHTLEYLVCRLLLEKNFFNDTATTEIYTLSLHDALPI